jgi:hypothetical protein
VLSLTRHSFFSDFFLSARKIKKAIKLMMIRYKTKYSTFKLPLFFQVFVYLNVIIANN